MIRLGCNIDHVATVRQARNETFPDPLKLALLAVQGGAEGITAHLREDRRHIQDDDIVRLKKNIGVPLNMEMAVHPSVVRVALRVRPAWVCLVPERRAELTTEGGLDLKKNFAVLEKVIQSLQAKKIKVSLFVNAVPSNMVLARKLGAEAVELHTGRYARVYGTQELKRELQDIRESALIAHALGLVVNAGHGLDLHNVRALAKLFPFHEFNIGFSIIARALEVGMTQAVQEMKKRMAV